jgi:hypothetical protein
MKKHVILDFIDAINCTNVDKIYDLMTIDHLFIDSQEASLDWIFQLVS